MGSAAAGAALGACLGLPLCCCPQGPALGEDVLAINGALVWVVRPGWRRPPALLPGSQECPPERRGLKEEQCFEGFIPLDDPES